MRREALRFSELATSMPHRLIVKLKIKINHEGTKKRTA